MFNIIEYVEKLEDVEDFHSWIKAKCPVCGGTLKINKTPLKYGAYGCYTGECHRRNPNPIKAALYQRNPFTANNAFINKSTQIKPLLKVVKKVDISCSPSDFLTTIQYEKPLQVRKKDELFTAFQYTDFQVCRIDRVVDRQKKKFFYQQYMEDGVLVEGVPTVFSTIPVFQNKYLQDNIVLVEGEKSACIAQKLGLAAITFPSFLFNETYLDKYFYLFTNLGIKNILYLEDNDYTGANKADLCVKLAWKYKIGAGRLNLANNLGRKEVEGYDIYDAYKEKLITKENLIELLEI